MSYPCDMARTASTECAYPSPRICWPPNTWSRCARTDTDAEHLCIFVDFSSRSTSLVWIWSDPVYRRYFPTYCRRSFVATSHTDDKVQCALLQNPDLSANDVQWNWILSYFGQSCAKRNALIRHTIHRLVWTPCVAKLPSYPARWWWSISDVYYVGILANLNQKRTSPCNTAVKLKAKRIKSHIFVRTLRQIRWKLVCL